MTSLAAVAGGATLRIDAQQHYSAVMSSAVNLTGTGSIDWAYWASANGNDMGSTNVAPTNSKSGGTAISNLSVVGGGNFRGTASTTADGAGLYSWSDGTTAGLTSQTNYSLPGALVFNSRIGDGTTPNTPGVTGNGSGFTFTVQGTPGQDTYVVLYFGGFSITGNLSLSLNNAAAVPVATQLFPGDQVKNIHAYQVVFNPDSAADLLTISFTGSNAGGNGHVGIEAVTVGTTSVIPEPSTALLTAVASLGVLRRRRGR